MSTIESLRASGLPLAMVCPGSVRPPSVRIDEVRDGAAAVGSAVHEALRALVEDGAVSWGSVPAIAQRHGASVDEVRMLCGMATKLWPLVSASFPNALTELEFSAGLVPGVTLTGHADLFAVDGTRATIGDWKSGRKDHDYSEQMKGYAALALLEDSALTDATATIIWIRDGEIENYSMSRAQLGVWIDEVGARVVHWDGVYHPSSRHCSFCPRSHECEAANAMTRRDVAALTDHDLAERAETSLALMEPAAIVELLAKADLVKRTAERVRAAIRAHVDKHGDIVAPGVRLTVESYEARELDTAKAWPVLEAVGFTDADYVACIDLHVSAVERRVAIRAGRGKGAAAVRELGAKLDEAGAINRSERRALKEKRT